MEQQRTLWDAIDRDRKRWLRLAAQIALLLILLGFVLYVAIASGFRGRSVELIFRVGAPLAALLAFPAARAKREAAVRRSLAGVPVAAGVAPTTASALYEASLAAGVQPVPALQMFDSDALNAFVTRSGGTTNVGVTTSFAQLPKDEQRAAMAMLLARCRIDVLAYASDHELEWLNSKKQKKLPPAEDPVLFKAWLGAAYAGDREALRALKDIRPMLALLERLAMADRVVPQILGVRGGEDAVYGFLAWPYPRFSAALTSAKTLPPKAALAVAELISEDGGTYGMQGDPELLRAARLRNVSGVEGAATCVQEPPAQRAMPPAVATAAVAGAAVVAPAMIAAPPAEAQQPQPPRPALAARPSQPRISVTCPACRSDNAPTNHTCIICGHELPQRQIS
jgi:hypothetical protein